MYFVRYLMLSRRVSAVSNHVVWFCRSAFGCWTSSIHGNRQCIRSRWRQRQCAAWGPELQARETAMTATPEARYGAMHNHDRGGIGRW